MNLKGLICDLDGTLLDSMTAWRNVGVDYIKALKLVPKNDLYEILKPMSLAQSAQYFQKEYLLKYTEEEIINQINSLIEDKYMNHIPAKPFVKAFLENMSSSGVKMCVATATDRYLVEAALKRLDILKYFDSIITCTEAGCGKDKPAIYNIALERLHTKKEETIVIEDTLYTIITAKKAGFLTAGIYDESSAEDMQKIKDAADWYFNSFNEWEVE